MWNTSLLLKKRHRWLRDGRGGCVGLCMYVCERECVFVCESVSVLFMSQVPRTEETRGAMRERSEIKGIGDLREASRACPRL